MNNALRLLAALAVLASTSIPGCAKAAEPDVEARMEASRARMVENMRNRYKAMLAAEIAVQKAQGELQAAVLAGKGVDRALAKLKAAKEVRDALKGQ